MAHQKEKTVALHIPSILGYETVVVAAGGAMAKKVGFDARRVESIQTALSEACLNAIEHGNREDAETKVMVTLVAGELGLQIDVDDHGSGFTRAYREPNLEKKLAGREVGRGWGIFIIRRLVDEVRFEKSPGGGNRTRMTVYFESEK